MQYDLMIIIQELTQVWYPPCDVYSIYRDIYNSKYEF